MIHTILMVDDDASLLLFAQEFLERHGFKVKTASTGAEAISSLRANPRGYSVAIVDYQMAGFNGAATTRELLSLCPNLPIVVYSGDESRDAIIRTNRVGAFSFVGKEEGPSVLLEEVRRAVLKYENEVLTVEETQGADIDREVQLSLGLIGNSKALAQITRLILKLRDKSGPVLILGETGTGKELVARALHGDRAGAFKGVNCANFLMSSGTARSELFGHVKGAFTGADQDRPGIFEQAANGTVFLDEVYALPLESQVGLLRALQERSLVRVGGSKEIPITSRIVAAAQPDLIQDISRRAFKPDLFHRISQNVIEIPPLRDRVEDIGPLVAHFCERWRKENGVKKTFLASTVERLKKYTWPGNARELENVVYSVLNITERNEIRPNDLGSRFGQKFEISAEVDPVGESAAVAEKEHIVTVLKRSTSVRDAANRLGLPLSTLMNRLKRHGLRSTDYISRSSNRARRGAKG